ncbi:MAG: TrbI/VirB10 family protein [Gloeotrichia echinulata IR180]|jgi:hypothetical protein
MTQVSISAATHPENVIDLSTENYPLELEASDWEARMARLVGFIEESDNLEEEFSAVDGEALEDLASIQSALSPSPEIPTEQPLSSNPFAKLGLVGTGTLAIVLLAGTFLSQMMSGSNQKPSNNDIVSPDPRSQSEDESPSPALEAQIETLKTKLALTEQAEDVKAAQQQLRTAKLIPSAQLVTQTQITPSVTTKDPKEVLPDRIPTPPQPLVQPRPLTVARTVTPPSKPASPRPLPSPKPETDEPSVMLTPRPTPNPTPNPLDEWTRLAKLGSYGQVLATERPNNNQNSAPPVRNTDIQQADSNPASNLTPPAPLISQAKQQSPKSLAVGTSAKAVLATAVFGETTRSRNNNDDDKSENKNLFVVRLKEPLKAVDGTIAIPANTELLTEINSLSEQGLVQLNVVKLITQNNGKLTERNLPPNALVIRGSQGKPLIANQFPNQGSSIAGMDLGLFALGGLGKAAELLNRTDSQIIISGGSTTTTSGNSQRNILAGVFEGGINTVVPLISQRNQQAISQMMQRTNIWFMPAGTQVEIYVNQLMQL